MSHCLRHNPGKYGLKLDEYGFVDLQDFLDAMNRMHHFQPKLTEMKIREIMHNSDKERLKYMRNAYKNVPLSKAFSIFYDVELNQETKQNK